MESCGVKKPWPAKYTNASTPVASSPAAIWGGRGERGGVGKGGGVEKGGVERKGKDRRGVEMRCG